MKQLICILVLLSLSACARLTVREECDLEKGEWKDLASCMEYKREERASRAAAYAASLDKIGQGFTAAGQAQQNSYVKPVSCFTVGFQTTCY